MILRDVKMVKADPRLQPQPDFSKIGMPELSNLPMTIIFSGPDTADVIIDDQEIIKLMLNMITRLKGA
jgi:hypothetical protein